MTRPLSMLCETLACACLTSTCPPFPFPLLLLRSDSCSVIMVTL